MDVCKQLDIKGEVTWPQLNSRQNQEQWVCSENTDCVQETLQQVLNAHTPPQFLPSSGDKRVKEAPLLYSFSLMALSNFPTRKLKMSQSGDLAVLNLNLQ